MDIQKLLDPELARALDTMPPMGAFTFEQIPAMRRQRAMQVPNVELTDKVERRDHTIPGINGGPEVTLRVHRPVGRDDEALPCVYWMHGGGYVMGTYEMEDLRFDKWCTSLGCVGVSVEYRLAPETAYPGPLDDCYAGLAWVHDNAASLGVDTSRLGIGGASAGGGLAAALALRARDTGDIPLAFQLLLYPMIDDRRVTTSSQWEVPVWPPGSNERGWAAYLGDLAGSDSVPQYAAPARATDLAGLPPALVLVGALDGFLDEDVDYAMRLTHAGVPTELHVYPGAPHGFDLLMPSTPIARKGRKVQEEWLQRVL